MPGFSRTSRSTSSLRWPGRVALRPLERRPPAAGLARAGVAFALAALDFAAPADLRAVVDRAPRGLAAVLAARPRRARAGALAGLAACPAVPSSAGSGVYLMPSRSPSLRTW